MALIKCPECGNECSSDAAQCPKCGKPIAQKSLASKDIGVGSCLWAILLIVGLVMLSSKSTLPWGIIFLVVSIIGFVARFTMWKGTDK